MGQSDVVVTHPNRDKPESKATKAAVVFLLLTSAALIAIVLIGGWEAMPVSYTHLTLPTKA